MIDKVEKTLDKYMQHIFGISMTITLICGTLGVISLLIGSMLFIWGVDTNYFFLRSTLTLGILTMIFSFISYMASDEEDKK
jgi:multisubunit Na+/H+ antiporter MnhG subunit